jgi:pimeloyl-ACP methyl ester carboxylesterase
MERIPVYFVPGLAAGKEIFRNIRLPEDRFEVHVLEWMIPEPRESLADYASRMAARIRHNRAVLVGVSFGGVMVQEMSAFLSLRALIIISSVKTRYEMPRRLQYARTTGAYRLVPTSTLLSAEDLTRFAIGPRTRKRLTIYQEYLSVRDKTYLDWAIKQMVCWRRSEQLPGVIHIHGDQDVIFPIKRIRQPVEIVEGGTHVMIINKGKRISELLRTLIEKSVKVTA